MGGVVSQETRRERDRHKEKMYTTEMRGRKEEIERERKEESRGGKRRGRTKRGRERGRGRKGKDTRAEKVRETTDGEIRIREETVKDRLELVSFTSSRQRSIVIHCYQSGSTEK